MWSGRPSSGSHATLTDLRTRRHDPRRGDENSCCSADRSASGAGRDGLGQRWTREHEAGSATEGLSAGAATGVPRRQPHLEATIPVAGSMVAYATTHQPWWLLALGVFNTRRRDGRLLGWYPSGSALLQPRSRHASPISDAAGREGPSAWLPSRPPRSTSGSIPPRSGPPSPARSAGLPRARARDPHVRTVRARLPSPPTWWRRPRGDRRHEGAP
jgi:hypothetical protein